MEAFKKCQLLTDITFIFPVNETWSWCLVVYGLITNRCV